MGMLGKSEEFKYVPFFWTRIFDKSVAYAGHCEQWDEMHVQGEIDADKQDYLAFYIKNDKVEAVSSMGRGRQLMVFAEAMRLGLAPAASEVKKADFSFDDLEKKVKEKATKTRGGCKRCCHHKKNKK